MLEMPPHVGSLSCWHSCYVHGRHVHIGNTPPYRQGSSAEIFISADADDGHLKLLSADTDVVPISSCIPRFHQKDLHLCSEDERKSYRFGMTWVSN